MGGELIFEGKKYISASRASKIFGYNSDYIGQLCRKGSLECRMVGRSWFVSEESLKGHEIVASQKPRGRIVMHKHDSESYSEILSNSLISKKSQTTQEDDQKDDRAQSHYDEVYFLDKKKNRLQKRLFVQKVGLGVLTVVLIIVFMARLVMSGTDFGAELGFNKQNIFELENKLASSVGLTKDYTATFNESVAYSANVFSSLGGVIGNYPQVFYSGLNKGLAFISNFLNERTDQLHFLVFNDVEKREQIAQTNEKTGVVVVPSSQDDSVNDQMRQYVTNSFSDEAEIVPDETGRSGVIKPVFRKQSDQEYLYVIVPVKEAAD